MRVTTKEYSETISVTKRSYPAPLTPQADNFLPGFSCDTQKLTSSVEVQTGDIVGFCTFDSGGISQIDMVTTRNVLLFVVGGYSMMFEGADTAGCNTGVMPQVVGDRLQQASIFRILHVSAEISTLNENEFSFLMLLFFFVRSSTFGFQSYNDVHHSNNK